MCGGSSAKTDRKTQLDAEGKMGEVFKFLSGKGPEFIEAGKAGVKSGTEDTDKAAKYYSDILSGDPTKVLASAGPEIKSITGQADQQKKEATDFGNRAGGTNQTMQDLKTNTSGQIADVIAKKREGAAAGTERVGAEKTRTGLAEEGIGFGAETSAGSIASNLANTAMQSRGQSQKIHDDAVQAWGDLVATFFAGM